MEFDPEKFTIEEGEFRNDLLDNFGRIFNSKMFKLGYFRSGLMTGYGKRITVKDQFAEEGFFKFDCRMEEGMEEEEQNYRFNNFTINAYIETDMQQSNFD